VTKRAITLFPATLTLSSNLHLVVSQLVFPKAKKKENFICNNINIINNTSTVHDLIIVEKNWENISFLTTLSYIHVCSC